ncbi:hypothetical protein GU271_00895 [Vibrio cholerae]|uniref:hypothetical protein n=1 Tax=Gammaproteobacteria TaxID=1236 RepID=UPI00036BBECF|nr:MULTISPECIES: hypothetical protein [Gammaproteobacteria]EGR3965615.1 hypothetical protein [Vibrio cholerae]MBO2596785.1 hypothetical protein [Shewanella algae]MDY7587816.1 hypothetical protein [Vibrio cholerae]NOE55213.1 hypothetical protein [Vibrio cholerae]OEE41247.1 hypothetical protein A1QU_05580 [Vibrio anguillarum]
MAKHLSRADIKAIVNLIRGWQDYKLTWAAIIEVAEPLVGKRPTRQSLSSNDDIAEAYKIKKNILKGEVQPKPKPSSLRIAVDRISHLETELAEVKEQNRLLKQQFVVWLYNAYKHGLKESHLNAPMPKIDRERSDGEKR